MNGTLKIERYYFTTDLCLAVILKLNNFEIIKIEKPLNGKRFIFYFNDSEKLQSTVQEYYSLPAERHPYKRFYNEMREIKNMIYNQTPLSLDRNL
jgi:hypothetical protein